DVLADDDRLRLLAGEPLVAREAQLPEEAGRRGGGRHRECVGVLGGHRCLRSGCVVDGGGVLKNSVGGWASDLSFSVCVCASTERCTAVGRRSASACVPWWNQVGLLPPTITSVGIVMSLQRSLGSGVPAW